MDLALNYLNLDALAEVERVSGLTRHDVAMFDVVNGQQVDRVACADVVVTGLEFTRHFFDEDASGVDLDRFSIAETVEDS